MRTFPVELSMLKKTLGYQCVHRTLGPSMLVRSDGFCGTMSKLHDLGWSEWAGFDYAKLDEDNHQDSSFVLAYTLVGENREVDTLEIQAIADVKAPWPSLSGLFEAAERMESDVAALTGIRFVKTAPRVGS